MRKIIFVLSCLLFFQIFLYSQNLPEYMENEVLVTFSSDAYSTFQSVPGDEPFSLTENENILDLFNTIRVTNFKRLHPLEESTEFGALSGMNRQFVLMYEEEYSVPDVLNICLGYSEIENAAPNNLYYCFSVPNDEFLGNQWALNKINMPDAWAITTGSPEVKIAVMDVGFYLQHIDLQSKYISGGRYDAVDLDINNLPTGVTTVAGEDYTGVDFHPFSFNNHGTHVAGIIAAETNNSIGVAGVGWNVKFSPVRAGAAFWYNETQMLGLFNTDNVINAIDWIINNDAARIINMSFGGTVFNEYYKQAITRAQSDGIIIVAASGNANLEDIDYPAKFDGVLAIGATNQNDFRCTPNDWGAGYGSNYGPELFLVAPGNQILNTSFSLPNVASNYEYKSGTSMAAPHVSAAIALLLSLNPNLTNAQIVDILASTAEKVHGIIGFHIEYGYGRLNVHRALAYGNYTFINNIQGDLDYGKLVIDEEIEINSGDNYSVTDDIDHYVRTGELPFILNWAGTTQKMQRWYAQDSDYNLNVYFSRTQSSPPIKDAIFEETNPVSIQNFVENSFSNFGEVKLKDPWYYYLDNGEWNSDPNSFFPHSSPFEIQNNTTNSYGGVFLNQNPNFLPNVPNYSVQAITGQTINIGGMNRPLYFQNWSANPNASAQFNNPNGLTTGVVFKDPGVTVQANFKGHMLSNNAAASGSNGQRKLMRDQYGIYHLVYTSMNTLWYTKSTTTNFGGTWTQEVDLIQYGDAGEIKNPSIDITGDEIIVVYEARWLNDYTIDYMKWDVSSSTPGSLNEEIASIDGNYFGLAYPVVAYTYSELFSSKEIFIVYRPTNSGGLKYARRYYINNELNEEGLNMSLPGTDFQSRNPSVAGSKNSQKIFIVYEQAGNSIKHIETDYYQGRDFEEFETISTGSGYKYNFSPSISLYGESRGFRPIVSWTVTDNTVGKQNENQKDNIIKICIRPSSAQTVWGSYWLVGDNVSISQNNSSNNTASETVIGWTQNSGSENRWVKRVGGYYTAAQCIDPAGSGLMISNGSSLNTIKALTLTTASLPYAFNKSPQNFYSPVACDLDDLGKITTDGAITFGRSGLVLKNGVEFIFNIGDVVVNDSIIKFIEMHDTIQYQSAQELNAVVRTNTFELNNDADFIFSNLYYVNNFEFADTSLTLEDAVNFNVELVNAVTGNVAGTFDNITYDKNNLEKYENISYQVNCSGIQTGEYYLRLVTTVNGEADYNLANVQSDAANLGKKTFTTIYFDGSQLPKVYDLSQNYPNPFNPSTVISWQSPVDSRQTIKVYDILGKEVVTLVDEFKPAGKYTVKFDGSSLASGVYLYQLKSGDFISTKKMMLVK